MRKQRSKCQTDDVDMEIRLKCEEQGKTDSYILKGDTINVIAAGMCAKYLSDKDTDVHKQRHG